MQYTKSDIRKMMSEKRSKLNSEDIMKSGHFIYDNLINNSIIDKDCDLVLSFASYKNEPDTFLLYNNLKKDYPNIDIAIPCVCEDGLNMEFYILEDIHDLKEGYKGIKEPDTYICRHISVDYISSFYEKAVCLMPGLAFDTNGNRSGYGSGFYDRYLTRFSQNINIIKVGICHDFQILEAGIIPHEKHDIKVDYVVSEKGTNKTNL